jgi:hypothetical protein
MARSPSRREGSDDKRFWDILAAGCSDPEQPDEWLPGLVGVLIKLDLDDLVRFAHWFNDLTSQAYSNDLWGAAYVINGGCSDDGFFYFRCWLIGRGKEVYDAALANPDNLADFVSPDEEYEAEIYAAGRQAWQEKGGDEDQYQRAYEKFRKRPAEKLKGRSWDFDDDAQVRKRLPRLAALYFPDEE